jgi:hypothetical protein
LGLGALKAGLSPEHNSVARASASPNNPATSSSMARWASSA